MALSKTGAKAVIFTDDIINSTEKRFQKVKEEKLRRIEDWKESITELTEDATDKIDCYNAEIKKLKKENLDGKNNEKIDKLQTKIEKIEKDKYTDKDLKNQKAVIAQEIMNDCEGNVCPFCGKILGSGELKGHLKDMSDEEIEKMNKVASRSSDYSSKYKKQFGTNESVLDLNLESGQEVTIEVGEQIHHIISVDPYSSTLRVSRLGNLAGYNVNNIPNLIALPYAKNISNFTENEKNEIRLAVIDEKKKQIHDTNHTYSEPGIISYEDQMLQKMSEIEQEVLAKSQDGCKGQSKEGRDEVTNFVKDKLEKYQEECKQKLDEFGLGVKTDLFTQEANVIASRIVK